MCGGWDGSGGVMWWEGAEETDQRGKQQSQCVDWN